VGLAARMPRTETITVRGEFDAGATAEWAQAAVSRRMTERCVLARTFAIHEAT